LKEPAEASLLVLAGDRRALVARDDSWQNAGRALPQVTVGERARTRPAGTTEPTLKATLTWIAPGWRREHLWWAAYCVATLLLIAVIHPFMAAASFQDDLIWYIPTIASGVDGRSLPEIIRFLFDPSQLEYGVISLNVYTYLLLTAFGPLPQYFIATGILLHVVSGLLIAALSLRLGFARHVAWPSAYTFLLLFPLFGAIWWPMAAMHTLVVLLALVVLERYIATQNAIDQARPFLLAYGATAAAALLASFLRSSVLILPAMMLIHAMYCAPDWTQRLRRIRIWLPVFALLTIYPSVQMVSGGEPVLQRVFSAILPGPETLALVPAEVVAWMDHLHPGGLQAPETLALVPAAVVAGALSGWCLLLVGERLLGRMAPPSSGRLVTRVSAPRAVVLAAWTTLWVGLPWLGITVLTGRELLSALWMLMQPMAALLNGFLRPLEVAMASDNVNRWNYLPTSGAIDVPAFAAALACTVLFLRGILPQRPDAIVLVVWYLAAQAYLASTDFVFRSNALLPDRWPVEYPSRYFVFVAPPFAIGMCSVSAWAFRRLSAALGLRGWTHALPLILLGAVLLCNALAIRLTLYRGSLVNEFLTYDYLRAAHLIRDDLHRKGRLTISGMDLVVRGVPLTPFAQLWQQVVSPVDPYRFDAFRFVLAAVVGERSVLNAAVNSVDTTDALRPFHYAMAGHSVVDVFGRDIDPFASALAEGVAALRVEKWEEAATAFEEAVELRPFILRHVLGSGSDEDLRYVTNGVGMRTWVRTIADNHTLGASFATPPPGDPRVRDIAASIEAEIDDYVRCLIYLAFLYRTDLAESHRWAARIHLFEDAHRDLRVERLLVPGAGTRLNNALTEFGRSVRFQELAFPFGREHLRKFVGARELVAVPPGDWPVRLLVGWGAGRAPERGRAAIRTAVPPGGYTLRDGFFPSEGGRSPLPRWTGGRGVVEFVAPVRGWARIEAEVVQRSFGAPRDVPELSVMLDGRPIAASQWIVHQTTLDHFALIIDLGDVPAGLKRVELISPTFVPREREPGNSDPRRLGVRIEALRIEIDGAPLTFVEREVVASLPASISGP